MSKLVTEEIRVQKSESFHWAINYDLFEFLQKYIHKLDAAYRFLDGNLPPRKQESLDYFYEIIQEHRSEIFENLKRKLRAKRVYESLRFQRGRDPLKSMGIGGINRRDFKDALDFVDWLLGILPDILGVDSMPNDILKPTYWSKRTGLSGMGYIPSGLYNFMKDWLLEVGETKKFYIEGEEISDFTSEKNVTMYAEDAGELRAWPYWIGKKLRERGYEST